MRQACCICEVIRIWKSEMLTPLLLISRAIELAPTPASLYRRGDAYKTKGLLEIAEQDYRRAARLDRKGGQSGMELPKS